MLVIKIENNISCDMLCGRIQKLLIDYQKINSNHGDIFLVIEIKESQDSQDSMENTPKLTHHLKLPTVFP
jgi:hypothetical protein